MSRNPTRPRSMNRLGVLIAILLWLGTVALLRPAPARAASGQNGYPPGTTSIVALGYYPDQQETQPWRGPLAVADTTTLTLVNLATFTLANHGRIATLGRPNLPLSIRFTAAPPNVCAVAFVPLWVNPGAPTVDHLLGISDVTTVSATQFTDPQGRFLGSTTLSDSFGSSHGIWLLVSAPSAGGSVFFNPGSY